VLTKNLKFTHETKNKSGNFTTKAQRHQEDRNADPQISPIPQIHAIEWLDYLFLGAFVPWW